MVNFQQGPLSNPGANGKEPSYQSKRQKRCGFDPQVGKIPWRRHGNLLQYSCLENPMDRGACQATVLRFSKSRTGLKQLSTHVLSNLSSQKRGPGSNRLGKQQVKETLTRFFIAGLLRAFSTLTCTHLSNQHIVSVYRVPDTVMV